MHETDHRLTGRSRFRFQRPGGLFGFWMPEVCVLEVEESYQVSSSLGGQIDIETAVHWRAARPSDMSAEGDMVVPAGRLAVAA